ncbi:MAG: prepilin peptidase [Candidatus Methanomethyliaceae archaeon]
MVYFILGLFLGSFLNNVAYRLAKGEKFLFDRSKCPYCKKILRWYELIPILSFLIQKGRCRNCKEKISLRYPITELITGLFTYGIAKKSWLLYFYSIENFILFIYLLFLYSLVFILALYDLDTFYISEEIYYFGIFVWIIFVIIFLFLKFPEINLFGGVNYLITLPSKSQVSKFYLILDQLFNAFLFSLLFLIIFLVSLGKGLGLGDVKIAFLLGLFLKLGDLISIFLLASLIGSILGIYNIFFKKRFFKEVPFIPFLFLGLFVALFYGDYIYKLVFNLMLKLS